MKRLVYWYHDSTTWKDIDVSKASRQLDKKPLSMGFQSVEIWQGQDYVQSLIRQLDSEDTYFVGIQKIATADQQAFAWTYPEDYFGTHNPVVILSTDNLKKAGFLKNKFVEYVLRHEFGHVRGLLHCKNIFCIMRTGWNLSFGRFCRYHTKLLNSNLPEPEIKI